MDVATVLVPRKANGFRIAAALNVEDALASMVAHACAPMKPGHQFPRALLIQYGSYTRIHIYNHIIINRICMHEYVIYSIHLP